MCCHVFVLPDIDIIGNNKETSHLLCVNQCKERDTNIQRGSYIFSFGQLEANQRLELRGYNYQLVLL